MNGRRNNPSLSFIRSDIRFQSIPIYTKKRKEKSCYMLYQRRNKTPRGGRGGGNRGNRGNRSARTRQRKRRNSNSPEFGAMGARWRRDGDGDNENKQKKKKTGQQRTARRGGGTMRRCDGSRLRRPSRSSIDSFIHSILQHSSAQIQIVCRTRSYRSLSCRITVPYHTIQYNTVTVRVLTMIRHSQALHAISKTCMNFIVTRSARVG